MSFSTMTTGMEYESPYKSDSPFSYEVEDGELSPGSGRSSPGTIRDNASDCGTQTDDQMENIPETVTTMRVHLDNTPQITQTPQEIARKIKNRFDNRRNLQSFSTNKNTNEQGTSTNIHSYEHNRLVQTQNRSTTESYTSTHSQTTPHQCDRHHHLIILQNTQEHKVIINNNCLQLIVGQTIYDFHTR